MLSVINMVIGLQLMAFFLFLGYDCWGEWMDKSFNTSNN